MAKLSGAEMVIQSLIDQGVKQIFGYPGGSVLDIYDAIHTLGGIEHILVRHEQAAVHMADGYARSTGDVGVVLVTSGPGATNTITGIATAYMDSVPLVILSGQVASNLIGNDAFQECDMVGISRPIVKHSFLIKNSKDIPETIKKAFYIASTGRPGPVVVDLPKDIVNPANKYHYHYPEKVLMRSYNPTIQGHKQQIKKALTTLLSAKKPVLFVGGGVISADASYEIKTLTEKLNLPVASTLMGISAFPGTDKHFLGMIGMHGVYEANMAMHNADVIVAIGARFDDRTTNNVEKYCPKAKIIHIDIDPTSISKTIQATIPVVGDAKVVLEILLSMLDESNIDRDLDALIDWWKQIEHWRARHCLAYNHEGQNIKPQEAIEVLYKLTKGNAYVTTDVGQHQMFTALYYPFDKPRHFITSGGLGTMGFGLPAALGVKLAFPNKTVVCVTGDGSIQMNIQELSTALQYGLPVLVLNLNNRFLGMVKQWQDMIYAGRHSCSYMESLPDFAKIAEAYGHVGIVISKREELEPKLKQALAIKNRLVFLDVMTDATEHVYPMQIRGGAMNEMWLSKNGENLMRYILSILTENEPGALSRIIGLFSQRGFNIETITTAPTEDPTMHRMTIQTTGDEHVLEQIQKQLHKLVNVYRVNDLTVGPHVEREIMLVKVAAKNSDVREEVKRCVEIFRGSIVDVTATHYIVQLSGTSEKLDSFLASVRETCNIVEIVRSGIIGLSRSEKTVK